MIKGIGSHFNGKLLRAFGEQVCDGIGHEPARLLALEGSSSERNEQVTRAWTVKKVVHEIMVFLQTHSVGAAGAAYLQDPCRASLPAGPSERLPTGARHPRHRARAANNDDNV